MITVRRALWAATIIAWPACGIFGPGGYENAGALALIATAAASCPVILIIMWALRRWRKRRGYEVPAEPVPLYSRLPRWATPRRLLWTGTILSLPMMGSFQSWVTVQSIGVVMFVGCPATLIHLWWKQRHPAKPAPVPDVRPDLERRVDVLSEALAAAFIVSGRELPEGLQAAAPDAPPLVPERSHLRLVPPPELPA
jgi:hypothetical protein